MNWIIDRYLIWWLRRGRNWWSWLVRRISERRYLAYALPQVTSLEEVQECLAVIKWTMEGPLHLFDCIHYPQRTWFRKRGDADDFACLFAELLYRSRPDSNPVLVTVVTRPIRRTNTVCVFTNPQGALQVFDLGRIGRGYQTYDEVVASISERAQKLVCWDIRNPITLEMLECHVPRKTPGGKEYLAVERNSSPGHWTCAAQRLQCLDYNVKDKRCMFLDKRVDIDSEKEICKHYRPATSHAVDKYHIRSSSYYSFIAAAALSAIPLVVSYFIPAIVSAIILGLLTAFLVAMLRFGYDELNENYKRGLRSPYLRLRSLAGAIALILAPVIQILFMYQIIPAGYLSWILLTGGLALAINKMDIDVTQVEEDESVDGIMPVVPASPEEIEGLDQGPFGIRIAMPERMRSGTNIVMTVFVVNNTDETRAIELRHVSPCFEPQVDSVPLKLKAKSAGRINFIVHVRVSGEYVVSARILDSGSVVAGVNKQISVVAPSNFRGPLTVVRTVMGLVAILITAIQLIPDIIDLL